MVFFKALCCDREASQCIVTKVDFRLTDRVRLENHESLSAAATDCRASLANSRRSRSYSFIRSTWLILDSKKQKCRI